MFKINNKNKIIFILSIVFLTLLCLTTFSQASYDVEFEGVKYTLPDFPGDDNTFKLVFFDSKIKYAYLYTSKEAITFDNFNEGSIVVPAHKKYSCRLDLENSKFSLDGDYGSSSSRSETFKRILYSNYDVYDKNGELVFQAPPQVNPTLTETLVEETTQAQITQQIQTMILGFLKYLTLFVVSVIAFYKGWKFLSTQLRKA